MNAPAVPATTEPAAYEAPIPVPIASIWTPDRYDVPDAPPSQLAAELGRQLAGQLAQHQGLYVSDHRAGVMVYVSEGVERLLGCPAAYFASHQYELIHPDDQRLVTAATVLVNRYIAARPHDPLPGFMLSLDYRLRHADGSYRRVLRQNLILSREPNGAMIGSAGIFTDITYHKLSTDVRFHCNQPDFPAFVRQQPLATLPAGAGLSGREQQVLALVLAGLTSQRISEQLGLQLATVVTHRRNIKRKVGSHDLFYLLRHLDDAPPGY